MNTTASTRRQQMRRAVRLPGRKAYDRRYLSLLVNYLDWAEQARGLLVTQIERDRKFVDGFKGRDVPTDPVRRSILDAARATVYMGDKLLAVLDASAEALPAAVTAFLEAETQHAGAGGYGPFVRWEIVLGYADHLLARWWEDNHFVN